MLAKLALILETQARISAWWRTIKDNYKPNVIAFLQQPSQREMLLSFSAFRRNRSHAFHEFFRISELIRHQTSRSLARRLVDL